MELGAHYGCHQRADRSFSICGYQFPVCARCTGIILSSIIAPIVYLFWVLPVKVYILLIAIMGIDGGAQYIGFKESTNMRRFVTGCMGGFGITSLKILVVCNLLKKQSLISQK